MWQRCVLTIGKKKVQLFQHFEWTAKCAIQFFYHFHYNFPLFWHFCHTNDPHTFQQHSGHQPSTWAPTLQHQTCRYRSHGQVGYQSFQNPLTKEQLSLLQKGPNFAITPKYPPIEAFITVNEQASSKFPAQEVDEFRSEVNRILKQLQQQHNNHCNLNPSQCRALTQLKKDNTRVVLTADKGVAMVIMDQEEYTNKAQALLQDTNTYKVLPKDLTTQLKNKIITLLKDIKQTGGLSTQKFKQLYPTSAVPPNFMACPKYTKQVPPSGPLFPVGGPSLMVLLRNYHTSSNPL